MSEAKKPESSNNFDNAGRAAGLRPRPRMAVIGTGIAGLSAAWLLKEKFDITVIESHQRAGMGIHTIDYDSDGRRSRIDIPLRVFCEGYYPNLLALYKQVGVKVQTGDHAGVFADNKGRVLLHYGNLNIGSLRIPFPKGRTLFSLSAWRLVWEFRRFSKLAHQALSSAEVSEQDLSAITLREFLQNKKIKPEFTEQLLLPVLAVTCTCDYHSILQYPADIILKYLTCGVWRYGIINAEKGVDDIVPRLLKGVTLQTGQAVTKIQQTDENGLIKITTADGRQQIFDQVVIASQAQQAAAMLEGFEKEKALLNTVNFESSLMAVHTDTDVLPSSNVALSAVSYILPEKQSGQALRPQVSVDLTKAIKKYQGQAAVFQTWNPVQPPAAEALLAQVEFTRPVVTLESRDAMLQLRQQQQSSDNRLWFCGSYLADKVPLLDAAVDSSVAVAQALGVKVPWLSES